MTDAAVYDEVQRRTFASSTPATADSLDRRMTGEAIVSFLAERRYAAVATTRADGRPHLAMTGFLADGAIVWLPAMAGTIRVRNVERRGYASVLVTEGEGDEHTMVTLEGPASAGAPDDAARARWRTDRGDPPDWATTWIRVDVERVLSYAAVASRFAAPG